MAVRVLEAVKPGTQKVAQGPGGKGDRGKGSDHLAGSQVTELPLTGFTALA